MSAPQPSYVDIEDDAEDPDELYHVREASAPADEYVFDNDGTTVADVNPEYPADDTVVTVSYKPNGKGYAFPESRLKKL